MRKNEEVKFTKRRVFHLMMMVVWINFCLQGPTQKCLFFQLTKWSSTDIKSSYDKNSKCKCSDGFLWIRRSINIVNFAYLLEVALGCRASAIIYRKTRVYGDYQWIIAINASARPLTLQPNATPSTDVATSLLGIVHRPKFGLQGHLGSNIIGPQLQDPSVERAKYCVLNPKNIFWQKNKNNFK